jgi:hypothetical protein
MQNQGIGLAAEKRQAATVQPLRRRKDTAAPEWSGHPSQPCLDRVKRGNPVEVRNPMMTGKPTARRAQLLSGNRMVQEAKVSSRKETGNRMSRTGTSAGDSA